YGSSRPWPFARSWSNSGLPSRMSRTPSSGHVGDAPARPRYQYRLVGPAVRGWAPVLDTAGLAAPADPAAGLPGHRQRASARPGLSEVQTLAPGADGSAGRFPALC